MRRNRNREASPIKPSRQQQMRASGLLALRHRVVAGPEISAFQEAFGAVAGDKYNGKAYTATSLGATAVGSREWPDTLISRPRGGGTVLTSSSVLLLLGEIYGLGIDDIELPLTGRAELFSKIPSARRQRLGLVTSATILQTERAAVNDILTARGHPRLKSFGIKNPISHVSIGVVDTHLLSDRQFEDPTLIIPDGLPDVLQALVLREIHPDEVK